MRMAADFERSSSPRAQEEDSSSQREADEPDGYVAAAFVFLRGIEGMPKDEAFAAVAERLLQEAQARDEDQQDINQMSGA